jgi:hypothetical protein
MNLGTVTKKRLLRLISELESNPNDKGRILGESGIVIAGVGLGAAAAGTVASMAGATSIWGISTLAGWAGLSLAAATPVGWIVGCAAVAGAIFYAVARLIRGGALSEGRKKQLLQKYKDDLRRIKAVERIQATSAYDRTRFICSLKELIEKDLLTPHMAFRLIEQVEAGRIPISQAIELIQDILDKSVMSKV